MQQQKGRNMWELFVGKMMEGEIRAGRGAIKMHYIHKGNCQ